MSPGIGQGTLDYNRAPAGVGARRVVLVEGREPNALALWVEGLPESACVEAANLVRESISTAEVELLRAEWAVAEVRERALREGIVLHAA